MSEEPTPTIVNPCDWREAAYLFHFGACGPTHLLVFGGSVDDALETAAAWLAEHAPGLITPHSEAWDPDSLDDDGCPVDHTYTESGWIASWNVDEVSAELYRDAAILEGALRDELDTPYFDRWDVCLAWYHFMSTRHEGQGSDRYRRLSRLLGYFQPSRTEERLTGMNDNATAIYAQLIGEVS